MNTRACVVESVVGAWLGEATEWGSCIPRRRMGIKGTEQTGRIELRVEDVAGYLITPGFVIIELHFTPISVETIADVRDLPIRSPRPKDLQ